MKNDKIKKGLQKFSGNIVQEIEAKYLEKKRNQKCLSDYCDGDLSDDMYTDGIEWEQYTCDKCGALHEGVHHYGFVMMQNVQNKY